MRTKEEYLKRLYQFVFQVHDLLWLQTLRTNFSICKVGMIRKSILQSYSESEHLVYLQEISVLWDFAHHPLTYLSDSLQVLFPSWWKNSLVPRLYQGSSLKKLWMLSHQFATHVILDILLPMSNSALHAYSSWEGNVIILYKVAFAT